jgi:hypothetical protein
MQKRAIHMLPRPRIVNQDHSGYGHAAKNVQGSKSFVQLHWINIWVFEAFKTKKALLAYERAFEWGWVTLKNPANYQHYQENEE